MLHRPVSILWFRLITLHYLLLLYTMWTLSLLVLDIVFASKVGHYHSKCVHIIQHLYPIVFFCTSLTIFACCTMVRCPLTCWRWLAVCAPWTFLRTNCLLFPPGWRHSRSSSISTAARTDLVSILLHCRRFLSDISDMDVIFTCCRASSIRTYSILGLWSFVSASWQLIVHDYDYIYLFAAQLPETLGTLTKLETMLMSNNKIAVLPDTFAALKNLKTVNLR